MRIAIAAVLTLAAAASFAASAPLPLGPPPPQGTGLPKDQCIVDRDLGNHTVVDKNTLLLSATGRNKGTYRLTMGNGCLLSAISSDPVGIRYVGGDKICTPNDLVLTARGGLCDVVSIVKLSPQEAGALPRKLKP
jgi:hypothetical protein